jgi:hypothetical protein
MPSSRSYLCEQKLLALTARGLGDDSVCGFMNSDALDEFFATDRLHAARRSVQSAQGLALVIGTGASLICSEPGCTRLLRHGALGAATEAAFRRNFQSRLANFSDHPSLKYKRAFFVDWRVADRHKKTVLDQIDYLLDTNNRAQPGGPVGARCG